MLVGVFGIISASATKQIYGTTYWSPLDIMAQWQGSPGGRAAAFFCASIWLLAQISVNISANSISFANDITTLAPKYFNIRRGVVFVAFVGGWAICPWIIVSSAAQLMNFMSAYAIFLAPIAAMLAVDYWLVKKRRFDVPALYDPHGIYRYQHGVNWRALVALVVTVVPLLPGLANRVAPQDVTISPGMRNLFNFNWLYGFFLSGTMYYALNLCFPDKATLINHTVYGDGTILHGLEGDVESRTSIGGGKEQEASEGVKTVSGVELTREI